MTIGDFSRSMYCVLNTVRVGLNIATVSYNMEMLYGAG